jgi:hypothetical protein
VNASAVILILVVAVGSATAQTTDDRLRVFDRELTRAAKELSLAPEVHPVARVVSSEEAVASGATPLVAAWVWESSLGPKPRVFVSIVWMHLMTASDARLRCWARHEVTHILYGHQRGPSSKAEADLHHDMVRHFMAAKWKQDSSCLIK